MMSYSAPTYSKAAQRGEQKRAEQRTPLSFTTHPIVIVYVFLTSALLTQVGSSWSFRSLRHRHLILAYDFVLAFIFKRGARPKGNLMQVYRIHEYIYICVYFIVCNKSESLFVLLLHLNLHLYSSPPHLYLAMR
ncbi:uncharacterized protein [Drosophila pseudoobscura]|uniref:Uncharacterized protein n=1 Tax=Drosophila pseudoobscura pseudoobscura TaxID=46245 RepID=A0A6I8WAE0_DROPS|nr:uncharacterized protein LOC117185025 [Drosophila pseudoobscura]